MTYTVLGYMPTILSLCLFISIVGTLSRMYRDSEMVIWFSSGRGLADFLRPLFRFAWPILLLIALFSLVGWPWANSQTQNMRERYERRSDIERVAPGEFRESAGRHAGLLHRQGRPGQRHRQQRVHLVDRAQPAHRHLGAQRPHGRPGRRRAT